MKAIPNKWKIVILFFLIFNACSSRDCRDLPKRYSSYEEAIQIISSATFEIEDKVNTSESSWIKGASYYSCDGKIGYFILKTDSKDYIHEKVPIGIWKGFKISESFGKYYNSKLKGRYQFTVNK